MADPNFDKKGGEPGIHEQFPSQVGYFARIGVAAGVDILAIGYLNKAIYSDGSAIEAIGNGVSGIGLTFLSAMVILRAVQKKSPQQIE